MKASKTVIALSVFLMTGAALFGADGKYEATWESLDSRPTPKWWIDAKFGIFVHWGLYSVPAYSPTGGKDVYSCYAEWYQGQLIRTNANVLAHHAAYYGKAPYANFATQFTARNFNPDYWAELFRRAGAKYAVLTAKHHDGYALWPTVISPYYNSVALGPGRDIAKEFTTAMRSAGLRSGFYFSLIEYANPLYPGKIRGAPSYGPEALPMKEWARRVNLSQMRDLVMRYHPDIIWPDGAWDWPAEEQLSAEFLAWLFNESPVRETVAVNDRWGKGMNGHHGGHYTTEYGDGEDGAKNKIGDEVHPWEECRGIGKSFGFNMMETPDEYMTSAKCIEVLVDVASRGGNLLLNVGPTADGRIPAIMQDRLMAMGHWLDVNGNAIYGTRKWKHARMNIGKSRVYFTAKGRRIYAIVFGTNDKSLKFADIGGVERVSLLGYEGDVEWRQEGNDVAVTMPSDPPEEVALALLLEKGDR